MSHALLILIQRIDSYSTTPRWTFPSANFGMVMNAPAASHGTPVATTKRSLVGQFPCYFWYGGDCSGGISHHVDNSFSQKASLVNFPYHLWYSGDYLGGILAEFILLDF